MENFEHKMRRLLDYYIRITGTRDPLEIAKSIGIGIAIFPLGNIAGNYKLLKRKRWIFINEDIPSDSPFFRIVVAHELGHAILPDFRIRTVHFRLCIRPDGQKAAWDKHLR